jgi:hypothetical protein
MDLYIVVSEVESNDSTSHYIHYVSESFDRAINAFESIDRKEYDGILLIKLKSDKMFDFEMFRISNYDEDIEIVKGYPTYNEVLKKR